MPAPKNTTWGIFNPNKPGKNDALLAEINEVIKTVSVAALMQLPLSAFFKLLTEGKTWLIYAFPDDRDAFADRHVF